MSGRPLIAVAALVAVAGSPSQAASSGPAPVRISAEVVRTCRVTSATPQVSVDCGTRPQIVEVRHGQSAPTLRTLITATDVAPATARTVTIEF